jgi:orotate phosphoribosyltransferase
VRREELARRIYEISKLSGEFTLRSGAVASRYFDKYRFEAEPLLLRAIAAAMAPLVPSDVEMLAGLEMGGIPLVTALSFETGLPALFVRKAAKQYGTCKLAEGGDVSGKKLLVVEDVVTSGGQILLSTADLRALGAEISTAVCVIDRESGGREKLAEAGLALRELYRMSELERAAGVAAP